jgi:molybdenum cofactor biosynthesis enzyme MoaA
MFRAISNFKSYHEIFAGIAGTLLEHLEDRKINKEFTSCLEWEEISQFCSVLEAMQEKIKIAYTDVDQITKKVKEFSALDYIKEDLNIRQSADSFRDAQYVLTGGRQIFSSHGSQVWNST